MLLKALGALTLAGGATLASMSYVVVDVREAGPKGMHLVVPVPLVVAEAALALAPKHAGHVELPPEVQRCLPVAKQVAAELRSMPDAELVRVQEPGEDVRIAKVGDHLEIRVNGRHEKVSVNVPLDGLEEMLEGLQGGTVDARKIVGALRHSSNTNLVEVQSKDGEHVKIWVW